MADDENLQSDAESERSEDPIQVAQIQRSIIDDSGYLCYLCVTKEGRVEQVDRSDLIDGGRHQRMVLDFERRNPPAWDDVCPECENEPGDPDTECEECVCPDCDRACRFLNGVNYGCVRHPVL